MQSSLDDFLTRPIPVEGWMHEYGGRGWIYRSNAEAVVHDLNAMPSGMGIWPRMMDCRGKFGCDGWDLEFFQCRGSGAIRKMISADGKVQDQLRPFRIVYEKGKPIPGSTDRFPRVSARIEGDELILWTEDGRMWSEMIVPDSDCDPIDVHRFDPENDPEHFLMACLRAGIVGEELIPIAGLPYRFSVTSPVRPEMDTVFRLSGMIGIVPAMGDDPLSDPEDGGWCGT